MSTPWNFVTFGSKSNIPPTLFRTLWVFSNINSLFSDMYRTFYRKYIKIVGTVVFTIENRLMFFVFQQM